MNAAYSVSPYFEAEIARNPYLLKNWVLYAASMKEGSPAYRYAIYERALKHFPRSYKLWNLYLREVFSRVKTKQATDKRFVALKQLFERALVQMNKMPRIWIMYLEVLSCMRLGTATREAFNGALQALPVTQHSRIWDLFIAWARDFGVDETTVRIYKRYVTFYPSKREELIDYLIDTGKYDGAVEQLVICLEDDHFTSTSGQSKHAMFMKLCEICSSNPEASKALDVEAIIRSGLVRFPDDVGKLWCRLAFFYTRLGQFERARDVYEEALNAVTTIKDFTVVFDSYVKCEEGILSAKMSVEADEAEETHGIHEDLELRISRLEFLLERRAILLNSVALRQNPHNVSEWLKRVNLQETDPVRAAVTYAEAVKTVDPKLCKGKLSSLWLAFAQFYEKCGDIENARVVFERASTVEFRSVDELAQVWCSWGEMELRAGNHDRALGVLQQAVVEPSSSIKQRRAKAIAQGLGKQNIDTPGEATSVRDNLHKSVRVWSLLLDLEEAFSSTESCRACYERIFELKVVTPQIALNYAAFLEERNYFEDSFKVYENAISLFSFPHVKNIWTSYLDRFMERYEGTKLERLRDLFEQVLAAVPEDCAAEFYLKYAKAEEKYGLLRHAASVYDRATRAVPESKKLDMYRVYIKNVEQQYGLTKTRPIYERAIGELPDDMTRQLCLEFAEMERKLGEVDRARAILAHGSQFADPRTELQYWKVWREFEEAHGNEDTFRDMLRVKRSVETAASSTNLLSVDMKAIEARIPPKSNIDALALKAEENAMLQASEATSTAGQKRKFIAAIGSGSTS